MDVFGPIMGMTAGGFSLNIFKNEMQKLCFWESGRFFDKICTWEQGFERMDDFLTKYGYGGRIFFREKYEKKMFFCDFLAHNIYYSFDRIDVFLQNICMTAGAFFMKNVEKTTWAHRFCENVRFYDEIGAWE